MFLCGVTSTMGGVSGERRDPFGSPTRAAENECGEHRELSSDPFTPQKEMHQLQSHRGRNVTSGWGERGAGSGERGAAFPALAVLTRGRRENKAGYQQRRGRTSMSSPSRRTSPSIPPRVAVKRRAGVERGDHRLPNCSAPLCSPPMYSVVGLRWSGMKGRGVLPG